MIPPLRFHDTDDIARVRGVLSGAAYRTQDASQPLVRLFGAGMTVDATTAARAVAPMTPEDWVEMGLLEVREDGLRAAMQLHVFQDLLVAADFAGRNGEPLRPDHVMGISASTIALAGLTLRRPAGSILDLGTGSGVHALLATAHAEHVTATDLNPRATAFARFNARLNERELEVLEGDLFGPVGGRTFDRIISNPPFVIAPAATHLFLHGVENGGDELCRRVAREAPACLNEGGICQFLAHWAITRDEDWTGRLAGWFEDSGCDVLVMRRGIIAPEDYAAMWTEADPDAPRFDEEYAEWLRFYRQREIEGIGSGLITMRKRMGDNWFRTVEAPDPIDYPAGEEILRSMQPVPP